MSVLRMGSSTTNDLLSIEPISRPTQTAVRARAIALFVRFLFSAGGTVELPLCLGAAKTKGTGGTDTF